MTPEDKDRAADLHSFESPTGLDLHPAPQRTVRVSKRAGIIIGCVGLALMAAYAYGGYRRTLKAEATARESGTPKNVAPATSASAEFTKNMPSGTVPLAGKNPPQVSQPATPAVNADCATDPRTGQSYRFDPQTGQPCSPIQSRDRVVVRRAPAPAQPAAPPVAAKPEPTPEQKRLAAAWQSEQDAIAAPTSVRSQANGTLRAQSFSPPWGGGNAASATTDLQQVAALAQALGGRRSEAGSAPIVPQALLNGSSRGDEYEQQNMQTRKQSFLDGARARTGNYLDSTRTAPLGPYEIKAGWEIPAVLEQGLNSDLPGELKALVTSDVYDTGTGQYLLIPQGSRLIGKYDSRIAYGQNGVQVAWSRIIFPDASSVDLDGMVGLDSEGNAGLRSKVDRHYSRMFGFAALSTLFTAASEVTQRRNQSILINPSAGDTATATIGREMSQTGALMTRRNMNVQPTIRVPVGYKFTVRVNRDMLFENAYEPLTEDPQILSPQKELRRRATAQ